MRARAGWSLGCAWLLGLVSQGLWAEIADTPFHVDLRVIANTHLEDDGVADNGKGGWTDQGTNDMFIYPPLPLGRNQYRGYPFWVIDASKHRRWQHLRRVDGGGL